MSSNLKVNSLVPATGTEIGIGTTGGSIDFRCPATFGGNVTIGGTLTYDEVINIDSIGIVTARSGVVIPDNKALSLGDRVVGSTAGDLRLYHDGSNSYIDEIGTGNLFIRNGSNTSIFCQTNGTVRLFNNGDVKLATSSTGVTITGTAVAGGLDISGDIDVDGHTNLDNVSIAGVTTITGSGSSVLFLESSNPMIRLTDTDNSAYSSIGGESGNLYLYTNSSSRDFIFRGSQEVARITGDGLLGIGTHTPQRKLHVLGTTRPLEVGSTNLSNIIKLYNSGTGRATYNGFDIMSNSTTGGKLAVYGGYLDFGTSTSNGTDVTSRLRIMGNGTSIFGGAITNNSSYTSHNANFYGGDVNTGGVRIELAHSTTTVSGNTASGAFPHHLLLSNYSGSASADNRMVSIGFDIPTTGNHANATIAYQATGSNGVGDLQFWLENGNTSYERLRITSDGNIGINETNPQQKLHVHDDSAYKGILINGNSAPRIAFARSTTTTGEWSVGIDGTNGNQFVINRSNDNSNRYVIISNGQTTLNQNTAITGILYNNEIVSITSTNDDSTSHVSISARNAAAGYGNYFIVGVSGNTYFGAGANNYSSNPSGNNITGGTTIRVYGGVSSNAYNDAHRFGRNTDGSIVLFQSAGGTEGSIAISGSQTNYNQSSDYRLKENIVNITDGITRLKQLQPRRFNFIKHPSKTIDGFIAHEVHSIVPQAVTGTKDETFSKDDEENNIKAGDPKYQQMDASKLIPLLTAALQEAITEIETLKTKVAALEGS